MARAAQLYRDFTGHEPTKELIISVNESDTGLIFGKCLGIIYETVRDGKREKYVHEFKQSARPLIAASHNGKSLWLIGGSYQFTERGIEDLT